MYTTKSNEVITKQKNKQTNKTLVVVAPHRAPDKLSIIKIILECKNLL